jgi:hypothetical protein
VRTHKKVFVSAHRQKKMLRTVELDDGSKIEVNTDLLKTSQFLTRMFLGGWAESSQPLVRLKDVPKREFELYLKICALSNNNGSKKAADEIDTHAFSCASYTLFIDENVVDSADLRATFDVCSVLEDDCNKLKTAYMLALFSGFIIEDKEQQQSERLGCRRLADADFIGYEERHWIPIEERRVAILLDLSFLIERAMSNELKQYEFMSVMLTLFYSHERELFADSCYACMADMVNLEKIATGINIRTFIILMNATSMYKSRYPRSAIIAMMTFSIFKDVTEQLLRDRLSRLGDLGLDEDDMYDEDNTVMLLRTTPTDYDKRRVVKDLEIMMMDKWTDIDKESMKREERESESEESEDDGFIVEDESEPDDIPPRIVIQRYVPPRQFIPREAKKKQNKQQPTKRQKRS